MKNFFFLVLLFFSFLISFPNFFPVQAATCSGTVADSESSNPITNFTITVYFQPAGTLVVEPELASPGQYSFDFNGPLKSVNFVSPGYAQLDFVPPTGSNDQCPHDVTLTPSSTQGNWGCINNACTQVGGAGSYADEATCLRECNSGGQGFYCNLTAKTCDNISRSGQRKYDTRTGCDTACRDGTSTLPACTDGNCSNAAGTPCTDGTGHGILTAIGCVPTQPKELVSGFIKVAVGVGGGIALLLMIFGAIQMMTSAGNPEGIKKGREQFVAAAIGLLFVIFSTLLLSIIGVDILDIPGLR